MSLFKNKNFAVMWFGQLATIFGNRFSEIAIPLIVLQLTGSPWQSALVVVCSQVAPLILSLPVGTWIEGKPKKQVAMVAEIISFLTMSLLVMLVWADHLTIWILATSLFILGATGLFFKVSFSAMVPGVVGRNRLVHAHSYFEGADAISTFVGPVLAGVVLSSFGVAMVLTIDAMTYFISFLGILFLTFHEKKWSVKQEKMRQTYLSSIKNVRYLFTNPYQTFISVQHVILNFSTTAMTLTIIIYTSQVLYFNEWQTGMVLSSAGVGNLVGVFLLNKINHFSWKYLYAGLMVVSSGGIILILCSYELVLIMGGMFLFDGALSMAFVVNGSARQAVTPDAYLARIGGGGILLSGVVAMGGNLFAGGVSESINPNSSLIFCAGVLLLATFVSLVFKQGDKKLDKLVPIEFKE
ncbi:Transmembrane secretion effector [Oceanobacillus limi]|uniref:Transmembrane secretion effector n=1 Tax=Oceanobacillus limi TaxID=930131 RepID=A0A1H9YC22_9BACI|nr:MFS transporter [Oceanobacillus limi]SES66397.1 Transmembrane secretion effector [Oceanobacillus limi]